MAKHYYKMKLVDSDGKITITKDDLMLDEIQMSENQVKGSKKLTRTGDEKISLYDKLKDAISSDAGYGVQLCNNPKCQLCHELCPVDAITFIRDASGRVTPNIDYNKCISCGRCIRNCPMGVFE